MKKLWFLLPLLLLALLTTDSWAPPLGVHGTISGSGGGGASDHGALTGLSDDDHSQYYDSPDTPVFSGMTLKGDVLPSSTGSWDLGSAGKKFSLVYGSSGYFAGLGSSGVEVTSLWVQTIDDSDGAVAIAANLIPGTGNTFQVGTGAVPWGSANFANSVAAGSVIVGGDTINEFVGSGLAMSGNTLTATGTVPALSAVNDPAASKTFNMSANNSLSFLWSNGNYAQFTSNSFSYVTSGGAAIGYSTDGRIVTTSTLEGLVDVNSATADTTVLAADCDGTYWYAGTSDAITFTLPTAAAGLICAFSNVHYAGTVTVDTAAGDILMLGSTVLDAGDKTSSGDTNAMATFMAVDSTYWNVTLANGSWSDAGP